MLNRITHHWLLLVMAVVLEYLVMAFLHLGIISSLAGYLLYGNPYNLGQQLPYTTSHIPPDVTVFRPSYRPVSLILLFLLADIFCYYILLIILSRKLKRRLNSRFVYIYKIFSLHAFLLFISLIITIKTISTPLTVHSYLGEIHFRCGLPLHIVEHYTAITTEYHESKEFPLKINCSYIIGFN